MSVEWIAADWPAPSGVVAGTTTRNGGVSEGTFRSLNLGSRVADDPDRVAENRRRFVSACRLPAEPAWIRQVHGTTVVPAEQLPHEGRLEADAVTAKTRGTVCAVLTADCLPILLCDSAGRAVAAVHAGWRGLAAGVVEAAILSFNAPAAELVAWLGPAISQPAFEVGEDVRDAFLARHPAAAAHFTPNQRGRWQADLYGLARLRLAEAGVASVHGGGFCTYRDHERFFSHRRDGECGRMASFVFRSE